ncbi:ribose 5-phosphate isomerase B [bacterium]|nr:ribose 5-phosphate isomerase B [bacterium]MBO5447351.1 ribose 5-phosphate isomerase B [bacterium]
MDHLKVAIGSDHGGFRYKESIIDYLKVRDIEFTDVGTYTPESCDYPDIARKVAELVRTGKVDRGILVCGTGIGMSIAANKVHGIRAALCCDTYSARVSRAHNNANILCLGERVIGEHLALDITDIWLKTGFEGGRHKRRVDIIE